MDVQATLGQRHRYVKWWCLQKSANTLQSPSPRKVIAQKTATLSGSYLTQSIEQNLLEKCCMVSSSLPTLFAFFFFGSTFPPQPCCIIIVDYISPLALFLCRLGLFSKDSSTKSCPHICTGRGLYPVSLGNRCCVKLGIDECSGDAHCPAPWLPWLHGLQLSAYWANENIHFPWEEKANYIITQVLASSHGFIHLLFRTGNLYSTLNQWLIMGPMYSCRGGAPLVIHSQLVSQGGLSLFPRGRAPCQPQLCQFAQCRYNFVGKEYYDVDTIEVTQRHRSSQMHCSMALQVWSPRYLPFDSLLQLGRYVVARSHQASVIQGV